MTGWVKEEIIHLNQLEKEKRMKPQVSRWKAVIKIRPELSEIENKQTIEKYYNKELVL